MREIVGANPWLSGRLRKSFDRRSLSRRVAPERVEALVMVVGGDGWTPLVVDDGWKPTRSHNNGYQPLLMTIVTMNYW